MATDPCDFGSVAIWRVSGQLVTDDPDLWFADTPAGLERAKTLCAACPVRRQCLVAALERAEPWGVWGGEIFDRGSIVSCKRPRGRPRKGLSPAQKIPA